MAIAPRRGSQGRSSFELSAKSRASELFCIANILPAAPQYGHQFCVMMQSVPIRMVNGSMSTTAAWAICRAGFSRAENVGKRPTTTVSTGEGRSPATCSLDCSERADVG